VRYLVLYDIADSRRLQKVSKILKDYGIRMQNSTFEVALTGPQLHALQRDVDRVINLTLDGVKYFPICVRCDAKVEVFGKDSLCEPERVYEIV
jgi:CRISPR-associated protein Cas2